jgi:hypothetical protein
MHRLEKFGLVLLLAFAAGCASVGQPRLKPPTLDQLAEMSKSGTPAQEIIKRIDDSGAIYRLSASDLVKLHDQGVPDEVLDHIHRDYLDDVRRDEAYRSYHYFGWYVPWGFQYNFGYYRPHWRHRRW